jgi:hypothetical protein
VASARERTAFDLDGQLQRRPCKVNAPVLQARCLKPLPNAWASAASGVCSEWVFALYACQQLGRFQVQE